MLEPLVIFQHQLWRTTEPECSELSQGKYLSWPPMWGTVSLYVLVKE